MDTCQNRLGEAILTNIHDIYSLGILNTILFNFSNNLFHLEVKIHSIQIVVITHSVFILNVGIKGLTVHVKCGDFGKVMFVVKPLSIKTPQ